MLDAMMKNLLAGLGITEADMLKAKGDFAMLAQSAKQLSDNQQLVYDNILAMRAEQAAMRLELAAFRAQVNPGFAGADFPDHFIPLSKDEILNPQKQLLLVERDPHDQSH